MRSLFSEPKVLRSAFRIFFFNFEEAIIHWASEWVIGENEKQFSIEIEAKNIEK